MTALTITRHGKTRMSQRGICEKDLEILLTCGTEIGRDRIMLKKRDAAKIIRDLKKQIVKIEQLTGKVLVVEDGQLVTTYHQATLVRSTSQRLRRSRSFRVTIRG